ncbi:MAG: reverse transcriptase domain-containing protein [Gammaproteobacteria bacterium]
MAARRRHGRGPLVLPGEGSPQGSAVSPLLANIYLHYVFDLWSERRRRTQLRGAMIVVRYGDDMVVGFEQREEAEACLQDVRGRFNDFGLQLHSEKTRLLEFGRFAVARAGQGKPETFNFLGFTHLCSQTRTGRFTIRRRTIAKRRRAKLQAIKTELRRRMHASVPETGRWLRSVLQGYYHYFAVPYNLDALNQLRYEVGRAWRHMLRRRSQKARKHLTWEKFKRIQAQWLPTPRLYHPWPNVRFRRLHPRQEPCAVTPLARICTGVPRERHLYRN